MQAPCADPPLVRQLMVGTFNISDFVRAKAVIAVLYLIFSRSAVVALLIAAVVVAWGRQRQVKRRLIVLGGTAVLAAAMLLPTATRMSTLLAAEPRLWPRATPTGSASGWPRPGCSPTRRSPPRLPVV